MVFVFTDKGFCILGDRCPFDHGKDPVVVDDLNFPGMIGMPLPGRTAASADLFSSLLPNSASNLLPIQPLLPSSIGLSMNTGVTLVPGQPRPVPSPVELPPRVPIYQSQTQPPLPDVPPPPKPDPPRPGILDLYFLCLFVLTSLRLLPVKVNHKINPSKLYFPNTPILIPVTDSIEGMPCVEDSR